MCIIYHFKYNSILKRDFPPPKYYFKIFWISGWAKNRWERKGNVQWFALSSFVHLPLKNVDPIIASEDN